MVQNGKRVLPSFDVPAGQYPNIEALKQAILRRYPGQIPGLFTQEGNAASQEARESAAAASWKVKVWLPDGLVPVLNQKDWTIALLSAATVDWMDGDLKVLVEME